MSMQALSTPRFVRRTQLQPNEYRKNFHQIDRDILAAITSPEADAVTQLMSKIYLRLLNAPERFWERDGVLRIEAALVGERMVKAWTVLCDLLGVSSATANKALGWMHEQGIIGYFSGKNGVGLRVFLNRAASSIGVRDRESSQKILTFPPASSVVKDASASEPAFNVPFGDLEISDTDKKSRAPETGAAAPLMNEKVLAPTRPNARAFGAVGSTNAAQSRAHDVVPLEAIVRRLKVELEPTMQAAAREAAAREHERTREWLESRGLPKAARVAQHEAFNVLRKHGIIDGASRPAPAPSVLGRNVAAPACLHRLSDDEVAELAQACVAAFETLGRSVDATLSEMSADAGGFLLPEDCTRVRQKANSFLCGGGSGKIDDDKSSGLRLE